VVFDHEAAWNFAIENEGIVIITADKSIIFVFHQTNFFFSRQILGMSRQTTYALQLQIAYCKSNKQLV
jgi:hypothetical protein